MMKNKIIGFCAGIAAALSMFALVGCAQIGVTPAQGFEQQLSYGYATVTAIRNVTADALAGKAQAAKPDKAATRSLIAVSDAQHVLTVTDAARTCLDIARMSKLTGDTPTALGKLSEALTILAAAQAYLTSHGVG